MRISLLILWLFPFMVAAQHTATLRLKVINQKREQVSFATVSLLNASDNRETKMLADSSGMAIFKELQPGLYTVSISAVNFHPLTKGISIGNNNQTLVMTLDALPTSLGMVVVTSKRPLMRQEDDKTIVDPENLVATSTSGYEVIEKTPGLFVDQDGNIYISSLAPAAIYINGREMKMSASDVATMLKSLPPNAIDRIEIVRTPSAKYDASGTGGIVNVVLKKGVKIGMTGSVNAGWQQGNYGNEFIGFNLNNQSGRRSSYINLNYSRRNSYETNFNDRNFAPDSLLSQRSFTLYPGAVYYAGFGISNQLNKKWEVSYDGRLSLNDFNNATDNNSRIFKISTNQSISSNFNNVVNDGSSFLTSHGISTKMKTDSTGFEWSNDLSYTFARNRSDQNFATAYTLPLLPATAGDGSSANKRHYIAAQSDLRRKIGKSFVAEAGIKSSLLDFNNESEYFKTISGNRVKDGGRTNSFHYKENINAAYLQGSKTFNAVVLKFGLRMENTNMNGQQLVPGDTSFRIHRTDFFPYIYLSRNLLKIAGFDLRGYLVYRRTISRPVYEQLNPFPRYVNEYLSEAGNPSLRPQFTTNYEANVSVDERPILAVGYNDTKDIFTNVIYQADSSQSQAYRTYDNLGKNKEWYFRGLGAIPPGKKYFFVLGLQYNFNKYDGLYEGKPLTFKKGSWTLFTYQTLKLGKLSQFTLNGFVRFNGQQQFYELSTFGSLNASINRQFMKQKLIVTLSVTDMFATNKYDFIINQGSVSASGIRQSDSRRIGLNLRYNFGIRKKEEGTNMFNLDSPENRN
jgi:iron complex outermembrane receptor protein